MPGTNNSSFQKTTLDNGVVVLTEKMQHVRSVALGVWVRCGSRVEPPELNGISHFIEHTVFKGTSKRTMLEIAAETDSLGGQVDAFTSKELVGYSARVTDDNLPRAFELISGIALDPIFPEDELRKEANVILEEIRMDEDNPEYLAQEIFTKSFWPDHPLGRAILGTQETVPTFNGERVRKFYDEWYRPGRMVISAAGRLEHDNFVEMVERSFGAREPGGDSFRQAPPDPQPALTTRVKDELTQAQLCLGVPCFELSTERRYALSLLTYILGGGVSSRLFQRVREQEGLAYAIFADWTAYRDTGCLGVYGGTAPATLQKMLRLVVEEIGRMKREPVEKEELRRAKDSLRGSILLSLESTSARMGNLARQEIYFGRRFEVDEILARVESVNREEILELAREVFHPEKVAATALGNLKEFSLDRSSVSF